MDEASLLGGHGSSAGGTATGASSSVGTAAGEPASLSGANAAASTSVAVDVDAAMELAGGFGASNVRCHVACGLAWVAYCQHAVASSYVDRNCDDDTPRDISLSCEFELIGSRCAKCARALSLTSAPATP